MLHSSPYCLTYMLHSSPYCLTYMLHSSPYCLTYMLHSSPYSATQYNLLSTLNKLTNDTHSASSATSHRGTLPVRFQRPPLSHIHSTFWWPLLPCPVQSPPLLPLCATSELYTLELFRVISANMFCLICSPIIAHTHFYSVPCLTMPHTEKSQISQFFR
jgi:hypothetical protein